MLTPPLFIAHQTEDSAVQFSKAEDLKAIYMALGISFAFYPLKGKRHEAWGATVKNKPLYKLAFDFIRTTIFNPEINS